jgi:hypothetical protein
MPEDKLQKFKDLTKHYDELEEQFFNYGLDVDQDKIFKEMLSVNSQLDDLLMEVKGFDSPK